MGVDRQVLLTKLGSFRFDPDLSVKVEGDPAAREHERAQAAPIRL